MHLPLNDTPSESSTSNPIRYTIGTSSVGEILLASSKLGICAVLLGDLPSGLVGELRRMFPQSSLQKDDEALRHSLRSVARLANEPGSLVDLPIDLHGTPFQKKVWEALTDIPIGQTSTYKEIAAKTGGTAQEVGEACAANRIALIIPCHRVVRSDGTLAGYRWGMLRKRSLLQKEQEAFPEPHSLFMPLR
jgi:AraC family transcriptional regulator, regulatory protein of adaptative response / methylated-DNA-[protein]-cysteine methyltransferase